MTTLKTLALAAAITLCAGSAFASLDCVENKATNAYMCFQGGDVREASGIRTTPLYMGGPQGVNRTPYVIATNCATGVMHLKDQQGVSFGGGDVTNVFGIPQHARQLWRNVCAATISSAKKK